MQGLIIYRLFQYFNDVPFTITSISALFLVFFDWISLEGILQYALRSEDFGLLLNSFKNHICWFEIFFDVGVGVGQFIF